MKYPRGQGLIEVLFALAIFLLLMGGATTLSFRYLNTFSSARDLTDANILITESMEAAEAIAYADWQALANGDWGLSATGGTWQFQASPDITDDTYARTVTIAPVFRDTNCEVVSGSGTDDPDTKYITATIAWQRNQTPYSRTVSRYLTRWNAPTICIIRQADFLNINTSGAELDEESKSIENVTLRNSGATQITIDTLTITWTKPANIRFIKIETTNHWHGENGIGTPQGVQPSATELDIVDLVMQPNTTYEVNDFRFDAKIKGATITITAKMSDGSIKTTPPFTPDD